MNILPEPRPYRLPRISAVVVTYFPEAEVLDNLRKLSAQVSPVIVVDNGSKGPSLAVVEEISKLPGVQFIRNEVNLGIGAALNAGIRRALSDGAEWVATFDQDSAVSEGFFEGLFRARTACPGAEKASLMVPGYWSYEPITPGSTSRVSRVPYKFVMGAPTSGSVIKSEVFATIGFYDEALFIDYVDTDFCLRLRKSGSRILSATQVVLRHELGEKQTRNILGLKLSFRIHTAWRYYYIMRNRVTLYERYGFTFPNWALLDAGWMFLEMGRIACLENDRVVKLRMALAGICHGLRGRTGRHPEFPKAR